MSRTKLEGRYASVNLKLEHKLPTGATLPLVVTYGLDRNHKVRSVFCSSFKAGTEMNTLAMDGCKLMSLLFQHGYDAEVIVDKLDKEAPSVLGTLAQGAMEAEK